MNFFVFLFLIFLGAMFGAWLGLNRWTVALLLWLIKKEDDFDFKQIWERYKSQKKKR